MPAKKRNGKTMQSKTLSNGEKDYVRLKKAESESQLQFDTGAVRPVPRDVPQPALPEEPGTVRERAKAMGACGPGSEYWLP
jgi:hypothetical protein